MNQRQYRESYYPVGPQPPVKQTVATSPALDKPLVNGTNWAMLVHLGQFAHAIVPMGGLVAPILIWQLKKDDHPEIDEHGKNVVNWMLSQFLFSIVAGILAIFLIGIPLVFILAIVSIVFPIIGAVKASSGQVWRYPMTINFFK